jgi:hypothetical protein
MGDGVNGWVIGRKGTEKRIDDDGGGYSWS